MDYPAGVSFTRVDPGLNQDNLLPVEALAVLEVGDRDNRNSQAAK
jgi:hypothetical protein